MFDIAIRTGAMTRMLANMATAIGTFFFLVSIAAASNALTTEEAYAIVADKEAIYDSYMSSGEYLELVEELYCPDAIIVPTGISPIDL